MARTEGATERAGVVLARFDAGDPLRALAALAVFVFHTDLYLSRESPGSELSFGSAVHKLAGGLNIGVWVFFSLSGYLLTRRIALAYADGARAPRAGRFMANRVLRLVPPMWLIILITVAVEGLQGESWWRVPQSMAFAQVYDPNAFGEQVSHLWTLDTEMLFYLLLAGFAWFAARTRPNGSPRDRRLRATALVVALSALSLAARAALADDTASAQLPPLVAFGFAPGLLLAIWEPPARAALLRTPRPQLALGGLIAGLAVFGVGALLPGSPVVLRSAAAVLGSGLVVGSALTWEWSGRPAVGLLDNPVLRWLGSRSYSFYLVHLLIVHEAARHLAHHALGKTLTLEVLALGLAGSLVAAEISYRLAELPYRRLHQRE